MLINGIDFPCPASVSDAGTAARDINKAGQLRPLRPGLHSPPFTWGARLRDVSVMGFASIAQALGTLICAVALGGMVFFAAVFMPAAMRRLAPETRSQFVREILFLHESVLAVLLTLAAALLWSRPEALVLGTLALLFVFSRVALVPRLHGAPEPCLLGKAQEPELSAKLRRLSTILTLTQIATLLLVLLRLLSV